MAKSAQHNTLIVLVLIIIGVVIVAFMLTKETPPVDNSEVETPYNGAAAQNFNFLTSEQWSYTDNAVQDIQSLTPGQVLSPGIVQSKNDNGVYYFAAAAPDPKIDGNTLWSFYQYNNDYTFERVYRLSLGSNSDFDGIRKGSEIALHPLGHDGYKLIVLAQDAESSPGPCTDALILGREAADDTYEMLSLDLLDPYHSGLEPYQVPDDIYAQAMERQRQGICAQAL